MSDGEEEEMPQQQVGPKGKKAKHNDQLPKPSLPDLRRGGRARQSNVRSNVSFAGHHRTHSAWT